MKIERLLRNFLFIIMMLVLCTGLESVVAATGEKLSTIATIPGAEDKLDGKYEFVAKFIEGKTIFETFGDGWESEIEQRNQKGGAKIQGIKPTDSQKGRIGVVYRNVGTYQGKGIDLRITINDWEQYGDCQGWIYYYKDWIGHGPQGYTYVDQTWQFMEAGTITPVELSGYITFNDIDFCQKISFDPKTSEVIDDIYVPDANNELSYAMEDNWKSIYDANGIEADDDSLYAMFTITFSNSSLRFRWGTDIERADTVAGVQGGSIHKVYENDGIGVAYFGFLAVKPMQSDTVCPVKVVTDKDEIKVEENTIAHRDESFEYLITHTVPDEWQEFYYSSYEMVDVLPDCLELKEERVKIFNEELRDVTDKFDIMVKGQELKVIAKPSTLSSSNFYFENYSFVIDIKIKPSADLKVFCSEETGTVTLKNRALVTIGNDVKESNVVTTIVREEEEDFVPVKKIRDGELLIDEKVFEERPSIVEYQGRVRISDTMAQGTLAIVDNLHPSLTYKGMKVYLADGMEITEKGTVSVEDQKVEFTFDEEYLLTLKGEEIYFELVTIPELVENEKVLNTFDIVTETETKTSNEVGIILQVNEKEKPAIPRNKEPKKEVPAGPKTGDTTNMFIWAAGAGIAIFVGIVIIINKRNRY